MKLAEFISITDPKQFNDWFDEIDLKDINYDGSEIWKYNLQKNGKIIPFKVAIKKYIQDKELPELTYFPSSYESRNQFCEKFEFDIHEDLVYDQPELLRFKSFHENDVDNKTLFQHFISYCSELLNKTEAEPYKVRTAITAERDAVLLMGMRPVISFSGKKRNSLKFLLDKSFDLSEINHEVQYNFQGNDNKIFVEIFPKDWGEIPQSLIDHHSKEVYNQYESIKNTKRAQWNTEANTTNSVLKYLMFKNEKIEYWLAMNNSFTDYWIFQCNPKEYFLSSALRDNALKSWRMSTHKKKVKIGDKVIIWLTGKNSGVYALAKITSLPNQDIEDELKYYHKPPTKKFDRVSIEIEHNLYNAPILKSKLEAYPWFDKMNVGLQGTNFMSSKEEYDNIVNLINNTAIHSKTTSSNMKHPLNQILYGPPGTGKTYNTINKAIQIANPEFDLSQDRNLIKQEYQRLVDEGQIVFTTFHQSMSYEDFIEGIKPNIFESNEGNKKVIYNIQDGIFKLICKEAQKKKSSFNFDEAYASFIEDISSKEDFTFKTPVHKKSFNFRISSNKSFIVIPQTEKATQMSVTKEMIRDYIVNGIVGDWKPYIIGISDYFKSNYDISIEDMDNIQKPFVLIIDEINRGNVSQIFGELITLIEEDKRLGNSEALEITLPYSKEKFGVPPNLYIIGTMNTADRSVEALDTALRRRFVFEEMSPKYEELVELNDELFGFPAYEILRTINQRIEKLIDRDHAIGHAYFLHKNEETIVDSFYKNIIPLLQEYFFGDYGKIGLVLGKGFVKATEQPSVFADFDYEGAHHFEEKLTYEIMDYRKNDQPSDFGQAIRLLMNL